MHGVPEYVPGMFFDISNLDKLHSTSTVDKLSEYCEHHRDEILTYLSFSAAEIAGKTTFRSMWIILKHYENSEIYIPKRLSKRTKLIYIIGLKETQRFMYGYFPGERIAISGFRSAVKDINRHIQDKSILEQYETGNSFQKISVELGISRTTVRNRLKVMQKIV